MQDRPELWQAFCKTRDRALREQLVLNYLPLVKWSAGRMKQRLPHSVQQSDLEGAGVRGLIQAVDHYDPQRGVRFSSFASLRIRGAMLDGLRELDWLPRSLRCKMKTLERARQSCDLRHGGAADEADVAAELGVSLDEYQHLQEQVRSVQLLSLDVEFEGAEGVGSFHEIIPDQQQQDPLTALEEAELRQQLRRWLKELPAQMRRVMVLYYYEELTLKEIGAVLGLSESRICQIHAEVVRRLRQRFLEPQREVVQMPQEVA